MNTHTDNEYALRLARESIGKGYTINMQSLSVSVDDEKRIVTLSSNVESPTPQAAVQGDELRRQIDEITYWMYESSGNSKYVLAGRKPLHPEEATNKLFQLFTKHIPKVKDINVTDPTKSSGELEEILDRIGYTPNLDSRAFAREAIESWHTTQTTKLQADLARCLGILRGLGHPEERLEREHKIGEDGENP